MAETASDRGAERLHLRTYNQYSGWFIPHQHRQPPYPRVSRLHIILNGEGAPHVHLLRWSIGPGQLQTTVSYVVKSAYGHANLSVNPIPMPSVRVMSKGTLPTIGSSQQGVEQRSILFLSARSSKTPPSKTDTKQKQESGYVATWVPQA
jgi:hypothetical protein